MFKSAFLALCWLMVAGTSAYFTITGLAMAYPSEPFWHSISDVLVLGMALCLGQYACIHLGLLILRQRGVQAKVVGTVALIIALVLSASNIAFSYLSISQKASASAEVLYSSGLQTDLIRERITELRQDRDDLRATVEAIPETHSSNRIAQQQVIQPKLDEIDREIGELREQLRMQAAETQDARLETAQADAINQTFSLFGYSPSTVIAATLALSLDPLAVILMMALTTYRPAPSAPRLRLQRPGTPMPTPLLVEPAPPISATYIDNSEPAEPEEFRLPLRKSV